MNSREIESKPFTFAPSGWLYNSTFILWDYESGGMWLPINCQCSPLDSTFTNPDEDPQFRCIAGPHADRSLPALPTSMTHWNEWILEHPDSKIMDGDQPIN